MDEHKQEKFKFKLKNNEMCEFISKPYNFKIDSLITERFGTHNREKQKEGKRVELEFSLSDVMNDFPKLLLGNIEDIDFTETEWDEIARVYLFFWEYKESANLRLSLLLSKMNVFDTETMTKILNLIPEDIYEKMKLETSVLSSYQNKMSENTII